MKAPPTGWPRISSAVYYDDANRAIDWLCEAFGFEVRMKVQGEGGRVEHSELVYGDAVVMVSDPKRDGDKSPRQVGGANTQSLFGYVDDVEAHCARARKAGAKILKEPTTTDYGEEYWTDRSYQCEDLEGHRWWFAQRLAEAKKP